MSNNFKIVLLGEGRVGKTSLTLRFIKNTFDDQQVSTIQATYLQKDIKVGDKKVTLNVWDTAGQERFHALGPIYYRNADGALLVYDITDADTFARAKGWVKELRKVVGTDIKITIAGNKCDMAKSRQVDEKEAEEFAKSVGATHMLTSAKANKNVDEAFMDITRRILQQKQGGIGGSSSTSNTSNSNNNSGTMDSPRLGRQNSGVAVADNRRQSTRSESRMYGQQGLQIVDDSGKNANSNAGKGPCC